MEQEEWVATKHAKQCGGGAHLLVPKRFRGRKFRIELLDDEKDD